MAEPFVLHPMALVHPDAVIGEGVIVEAYAVVGPGVTLGSGAWIGHHAVIDRNTTLGADCRIFHSAFIGAPPQDLKYRDEETRVEVGERTTIREFSSVHRGTTATGITRIGTDALLMAYTHVAHDCEIGNRVIMANGVQLGGHVHVGDWAIIGGLTPVHQFCRIGAHAMVGGGLRASQDVAPFMMAADEPMRLVGINSVGLRRRGFSPESITALKRAHRLLCRSHLNTEQAVTAIREQLPQLPEIDQLLSFLSSSHRGFVK
ncbi:MAG: acyl-ACP--UDP-N-acetylglucosamine O-acyltransferase [Candidatus Eisenbacteria bacterium]|nr:acyl-ACP--UDP-N-acetylglucosamine O-acyltransferase [Candidatus Eisenbacteria bacterium]